MISDLTQYLTVPQSTSLLSNMGLNDSLVEFWTIQKHKKGAYKACSLLTSVALSSFWRFAVIKEHTYGGKNWRGLQLSNSQNPRVTRTHLNPKYSQANLSPTSSNPAACHPSPSGKIRTAQNLAVGLVWSYVYS